MPPVQVVGFALRHAGCFGDGARLKPFPDTVMFALHGPRGSFGHCRQQRPLHVVKQEA
jgi:hypothetical protein